MVTAMDERRRYTGTQRLQIAWSLGIVVIVGLVLGASQTTGLPVSPLVVTLALSVVWLVGLGTLGFRERRQWNRMVDQSSFTRQVGPHAADLEKIVEGRSVTVSTTVPGLVSQTHTEISANVTGVDASFSVEFERIENGSRGGGVTTGDDSLDERYLIEGSASNVDRILSPDVRSALLDIQTPGVCTVTGETVTFEVPFTNLSQGELDSIAEAVVTIAERVETVGTADR
jgi:hypothetical protein